MREEVHFLSGGARCEAWLYRPAGTGPHPCIVMAHGFGGIRAAGLGAFAERFESAGYAVLVFDYRHFGTSEGQPRGLIDIERQQDDYRAAVRFARSLPDVDPGRIALWGTSFSAGHVLTIASEDPAVAAGIIQNPFVDGPPTIMATLRSTTLANSLRLTAAYVRDEFRSITGRPPHRIKLVAAPGSLAVFTTPDAEPGYRALLNDDATGWEESVPARVFIRVLLARPIRRSPDIKCPLLVAVCDRDQVTPAKPAARVARRAPRGELVRYPIGHFDLYSGEPFERVIEDQIAFFHNALRAATPRTANIRDAGSARR